MLKMRNFQNVIESSEIFKTFTDSFPDDPWSEQKYLFGV